MWGEKTIDDAKRRENTDDDALMDGPSKPALITLPLASKRRDDGHETTTRQGEASVQPREGGGGELDRERSAIKKGEEGIAVRRARRTKNNVMKEQEV